MSDRTADLIPSWANFTVCPICHGELSCGRETLGCPHCRKRFQLYDGIPCFNQSNDFYDTYAIDGFAHYKLSPEGVKEKILRYLPFWSWREWKFWRRTIPHCSRLLDIGCGRGRQLFKEKSKETVGFDGSIRFAQECNHHYDAVILGDLPGLPFRSNYFDVVVSSHVLGHVPNKDKESLFAEINRVLKPGGLTAHIIETDSLHRVVKTAKKHPAVYQKQFIEQDGHIGLELAPTILKRFERNGFRLESLRLVDALVPSLQNFRKYLNHPGFENLPGVSTLRRLNKWEQRSRLVNFCYEIGMGCFHQTVEQWCGAPTNAQFIIGSWRKGG